MYHYPEEQRFEFGLLQRRRRQNLRLVQQSICRHYLYLLIRRRRHRLKLFQTLNYLIRLTLPEEDFHPSYLPPLPRHQQQQNTLLQKQKHWMQLYIHQHRLLLNHHQMMNLHPLHQQ
jgi:hypothetical protein